MKVFVVVLSFVLFCELGFAGGPLNVAGVNGFQPGLAGTPITWANGNISYYTDQGDLSPLLSNAQADQLVAGIFSHWTSIPTVAVSATRSGGLNEDVNGTNVTMINGTLSVPADLRADSGKPLAVVYDADGLVFDALLGPGTGAPEMCSTNSVYATVDKITDDGHISHALLVINGNCAKTSAQIAVLRYRLARALGRIFGLDYSQLNENVITGSPAPTLDDYAGIPVMHPLGAQCNEAGCLTGSEVPRMDDRAALSRLYPVTADNLSSFPGKQLFRENTVRIHGNVRFDSSSGDAGQGMQGVNVVARLVDPLTHQVSRKIAASCVSGLLFRGNAGNPLSGFMDASHQRFDRYGSDDPALEGFFDLAGLEVPSGYADATYEISVEPVNPLYIDSISVGPYKQGAVTPSGTFAPVRVAIARGEEVSQDITMQASATEAIDAYEPNSFSGPASVPASGDWTASLSGYGDGDYVTLHGHANRSFTFDVTALDEEGNATTSKSQPLIGLWASGDAENTPRKWEQYFNSTQTGTTLMQATFDVDGDYKLGVIDARGDGRPDFAYRGRLFYADEVSPSQVNTAGGMTLRINGFGFTQNTQVTVGGMVVSPISIIPNQITFLSPDLAEGTYNVLLQDLATGATSEMGYALQVSAAQAREAKLVLVNGSNPQVPVGTVAPNPIRVRVVDAETGDGIEEATVLVTAPASATIVGCSQSPCSFFSDQSGTVDIRVQIDAAGPSIITIALASGGAPVQATVNGVLAPIEITVQNPAVYVSSGADATVPISATVVVNGVPAPNKTVNFLLNSGTSTIYPASAVTGSDGVASSTATVNNITSDVNLSACVAPDNAPCRTVVIHAVVGANVFLRGVDGDGQLIEVGGSFAPITVRLEEATGRAVAAVPVTFHVDVYRVEVAPQRTQRGDGIITQREQPVILGTFSVSTVSDASGMATLASFAGENQPVRVVVRVDAGQSEARFVLNSIWGQSVSPNSAPMLVTSSGGNQPTR